MGRPRAGNGRTFINGKWLIANDDGVWVPTGVAVNWPRCSRCRKPTQYRFGGRGLCNTCYYYRGLPKGEFWQHEKDWFFPYTLGRRIMHSLNQITVFSRPTLSIWAFTGQDVTERRH